MKREYAKRTSVLVVLILCATLARMVSDQAGVKVDPWVVLGKVSVIAGMTSVIYFVAFALADLAFGDVQFTRRQKPKTHLSIDGHTGKIMLVMIICLMTAPLAAILGGYGK